MKEYKIVIKYIDGRELEAKFESYKLAMDRYRELKKEDLTQIHMISFNQITDGITKELFCKKVCENKSYKTCREIANNIDNLLETLEVLKKHHESVILISERKRELLLHLIDAVGQKVYQDKKEEVTIKLNLFNELALHENNRRVSKSELNDIYIMQESSSKLNVDSLLKPKQTPKLHKESTSRTRAKYERIVNFKDEKEKELFIKQNKNFAYYIIDDYTSTIYFYNKFDRRKSFNEFQKSLNKSNVVKLAVRDIQSEESEKVQEDKISNDDEIKILEYNTIKQKGHYERQYKNKYKYMKADGKKLYFSNNPIDLNNMEII